ncbi:hypothetical protein JMA_32560 [Jeotgalibacillus malaysiensis]|uniref:Uncharacterized protein n=1 Tax=Jeotgalibacillus malaysiensis TaxID=1508404 RepID=A0A0B5AVF2_9BACL|nr:hypothetical protein JMA_32560 [Jeotgalibacillus malaysiensis]
MNETSTMTKELGLKGCKGMSDQKENMIVMTRRKFFMFLGGTVFLSIFFYGFFSQLLDR